MTRPLSAAISRPVTRPCPSPQGIATPGPLNPHGRKRGVASTTTTPPIITGQTSLRMFLLTVNAYMRLSEAAPFRSARASMLPRGQQCQGRCRCLGLYPKAAQYCLVRAMARWVVFGVENWLEV